MSKYIKMKDLLKDEEPDFKKKKNRPQFSFHPVFLAQDME